MFGNYTKITLDIHKNNIVASCGDCHSSVRIPSEEYFWDSIMESLKLLNLQFTLRNNFISGPQIGSDEASSYRDDNSANDHPTYNIQTVDLVDDDENGWPLDEDDIGWPPYQDEHGWPVGLV